MSAIRLILHLEKNRGRTAEKPAVTIPGITHAKPKKAIGASIRSTRTLG